MKHDREKLRAASGAEMGRGRGVVVKGFKNGSSAGRRIAYIVNPSKGAQLIHSTCDPGSAAKTMRIAAARRPDISSSVGHISISLPPDGFSKTEREWKLIVETLLKEIDLDDGFPLVCSRHRDTQHDHVHIVFSRVSVDGRVHDQTNLGLRLQAAEVVIEDKFSLPLFPRSEMSVKVTKNEIEMASREGKPPPRMEIKNALEAALNDTPTLEQLVERLALAGVDARINKSPTTGRIAGLSFEYGGIPFPASKIGKEYGWKRLQERINYEREIEDAEQDAQRCRTEGPASDESARTDRRIAIQHEAGDAEPVQETVRESGENAQERTAKIGRAVELRVGTVDRCFLDRDTALHHHSGVRNPSALVRVHKPGFDTPAWFLLGDSRPVAVGQSDGGIVFPDHLRLSDEQLSALIKSVGEPVVLFGDEEYLARAAKLCDQLGIAYEFEQPQQGPEEESTELEQEVPARSPSV